MSTESASLGDITISQSFAGQSYRLPYRSTRPLLAQAIKPFLMGLLLVAVGIGMLCFRLSFGFVPLCIGIAWIVFSTCVRYTYSQADLTGDELVLTEWFGFVPHRRPRPRRYLRKLVVHRLKEGDGAEPPPNGVIEVVCEGAQTLWFACGYPYELLVALAADLAERCNVPHAEAPCDGSRAIKIPPLFMEPLRDEDTFDHPDQPAGSHIVVERTEDGITIIDVPPCGLFGSPTRFVFFMVPWAALVLSSFLCHGVVPLPWNFVTLPALTVPGLVIYGWHLRKRRTLLVVGDEELCILRTGGPFGDWTKRWPRPLIQAIRVGPGHIGQRGKRILELYIYFRTEKEYGLFCGRANDELAWLATVLRQELNVPPVARARVAD